MTESLSKKELRYLLGHRKTKRIGDKVFEGKLIPISYDRLKQEIMTLHPTLKNGSRFTFKNEEEYNKIRNFNPHDTKIIYEHLIC